MKPRKATYLMHRWLGAIIAVQLLAWSVGGFVFSILDINDVRGASDANAIVHDPLTPDELGALPEAVAASIRQVGASEIGSVTFTARGLGAFWEVRSTQGKVIARLRPDGSEAGLISSDDATRIATRDFVQDAKARSAELLLDNPPTEYRGGALPAYRVELDHPKNPHIYIHAPTGQITARRNDQWRAFDFFWMLHTMDYAGRDNFNHPLLTIASVIAILTTIAGLSLWAWRFVPRKKRAVRTAEVDM